MTERKFKRILNSKPYLMDGLFVRSRYDAQQMALASMLTIEQVLQPIRRNLDISESSWARIDLAFKSEQCRSNYRATIKEWFDELGRGIKAHRRIIAVAAAVVLVIAFFTLIPRGRTLAKGAFDYFANVIENHIKIEPTSQAPVYPGYIADDNIDPDETVNEYGEIIIEYDDFESFTDELGLNPIRLTSADFTRTGITLTKYAATGLSLTSLYTSSSGDIVITQEWLLDGSMSFHSNSDSWESIKILDGIEMLYAIDKVDGVFDGIAILKDSVLWVSAQKSVDILEQLPKIGY